MTDALAGSESSLTSWFNAAANRRAQITRTIYDIPFYGFSGESIAQRNLRNRVSYTQVIDTITNVLARNSSYYSYDIHGNVDTLLQDFGSNQYFPSSMNAANRFKRIVYDYDLISGKVNQVSYQPNRWDAYYHRYFYDGENRLVDVLSGRDSIMLRHFPEREARYIYYKHGPLGRTVIGQLQVQGLDYAYTLQGWLKGINPVMGGSLRNGTDSVEAYPVAQDAYGFSLHYFKDDYRAY